MIQLHNHSDFSLLDGAQKVKDLVAQASFFSASHVALTDHGNVAGWVKFQNECEEKNVKPIPLHCRGQ